MSPKDSIGNGIGSEEDLNDSIFFENFSTKKRVMAVLGGLVLFYASCDAANSYFEKRTCNSLSRGSGDLSFFPIGNIYEPSRTTTTLQEVTQICEEVYDIPVTLPCAAQAFIDNQKHLSDEIRALKPQNIIDAENIVGAENYQLVDCRVRVTDTLQSN